ncbi:MAG: hypothetical protein PHE79_05850 [Eubacteriales bacterium]|nr:hypothetical protein [Eubacteriales bacterium]
MKNQIIKITREETDSSAAEFFMKISGLSNIGDKNERMLRQGICLRDRIQDKINIRAVVSSFPCTAMKRNIAMLNDVMFECNAFQSFDPNGVRGIYAFILTAGDFNNNEHASVLDQLYIDIWGTSYVEAGLSVLKWYIEQDLIEGAQQSNKDFTILDHFGPGFYGMDISQLKRFFILLDSDSIGVKLESRSLMIPIKSCAGFFIAVDDGTKLPKSDCKNCRAEYKNCLFCHSVFN